MGRPFFATWFFCVLFFTLQSLALVDNSPELENEEKSQIDKIFESYQFKVDFKLKTLKAKNSKRSRCRIYDIRFMVDDAQNPSSPLEIFGAFYLPNVSKVEDNSLPFVLQFPPISGVNMLDKKLASDLCRRKTAAMVIANDFTGFDGKDLPPPEDHMLAFRRMVSSAKGALEFVKTFPQIDINRAGLFGVSLGGILGSMTFSLVNDFSAAYFLVAGSDAPAILAASKEKRVSRLRKLRMRKEQIETKADYETYLRSYMSHDTANFADRVSPDTLNLVISNKDDDVPTKNQLEMKTQFGDPETIFQKSGHSSVIINMMLWGKNRVKILDFFSDKLSSPNPR